MALQNGSPSSRRSTPSRSTPNGLRRVNGFHNPFPNSLNGSPSLQALEDYGRVYASEQRNLKRSLDDQTSEQQAKHIRALDYGLQEHERIRQSAERELEWIRLENEREQRRQAELEAQRIEDARRKLEQQKEDEQRRRVESERTRQEEQLRNEETRRREEEAAKQRAAAQQQHDQEERTRKEQQEKQESDRKAREEAEAKEREQQLLLKERQTAAQQTPAPTQQPDGVASSSGPAVPPQNAQTAQSGGYPPGFVSTPNELESTHQKYMELHRRLKAMRKQVVADVKALGQKQKEQLTEWRQAINRCIGMLRKHDDPETKSANAQRMKAIMGYLDAAARTTEPMIDITQFIVENHQPPGAPKEGPAQLLYLLHYFSKSIVRQIIAEASLDPDIGNAIGIMAVTIFARPNYLFNGQSLIDILWAKYHKRCPVLFGISGNEGTVQGRLRIGWDRNGEDLAPEQYYTGLRGLGVGFANITLRSFAKSQNANPAPNRIFWQAMARMLNTPSDQVQATHFELLKAIVEHTTPRITSTFGSAAVALIRQAVLVFPEKHEASLQNPSAKAKAIALTALPHILNQKYKLKL